MDECFKCGISGNKTRLFDAVSSEGIMKICRNCYSDEPLPLIRKPTSFQIKESEKRGGFKEDVKKFEVPKRNDLRNKQNVSLRDIVDRNLKMPHRDERKPRPDLIENFHWVIQRMRKARHISREQFARDLGESETLVKMIEQGILPEDDNRIINKIEGYFGVKLRKPEFQGKVPERRELGFDSVSVKNLTISDLKEMKKQRIQEDVEIWKGEFEEESEEKEDEETEEKEISDEEMDDLIFGRKT